MKSPGPLPDRKLALWGMAAVLVFAVLFTVVALTAEPDQGSQAPGGQPVTEVDVDVRRPAPRHSAHRSETPRRAGSTATPRGASTPR